MQTRQASESRQVKTPLMAAFYRLIVRITVRDTPRGTRYSLLLEGEVVGTPVARREHHRLMRSHRYRWGSTGRTCAASAPSASSGPPRTGWASSPSTRSPISTTPPWEPPPPADSSWPRSACRQY